MTFPPPSTHGAPQHPGPPPGGPPPGGPPGPPPGPPGPPSGSARPPVGPPTAYIPRTEPPPPASRLQLALTLFAAASLAAVAIGISVPEDGHNAWHAVKAWGGVALIAAALTFAPSLGSAMRLTPYRAWQVAAGGAAGLALYWVLFVLPDIGKNTSLATTVGVAAGLVVAWIAPGRQPTDGGPPGAHSRPPGPTW